jgi:ATP/maltotriose-dependent transcriptional regulator MalT
MVTPAEADPELPTFSLEAVAGLSGFARSFMRKFDKSRPAGSVLVFDNVQDVDDEAFFYTLIHIGLQELTADKHVVLISRSNPHRLLAAFSAGRELTFVNWLDLRFADEEARALVALLTGEHDPAYQPVDDVSFVIMPDRC